MVLQPHNSEFTLEFLQDLSQFVVMVLQPHNSEFTLEFLQDLRTISKQSTQNFNQIHTRTCKSLCKIIIKSFNIKFNSTQKEWLVQLHRHSTKHKTTQVPLTTGSLVSKWGGKKESNSLTILQTSLLLNTFRQNIKIA